MSQLPAAANFIDEIHFLTAGEITATDLIDEIHFLTAGEITAANFIDETRLQPKN